MTPTKEITKDWTITKIVNKYPKTVSVLLKYNMHCAECADKDCITIGDKANACHKDINNLLNDLNQIKD